MILTIARKEFTEIARDNRFRLAAILILVLISTSLVTGWQRFATMRAQYESGQHAERERWLNQGVRSPHVAAHQGIIAFRPPTLLSTVDTGITPFVGIASHLEAENRSLFEFKPAEDATEVRRFGEMSAAITLQVLMPLLIILFGYTSFVGEREQGTLRQVLSLGVKRRDLILGKLAGTTLPLILIIVPATIIGVAAIALSSDARLLTDTLPRLLLMIAAYLLYFGIFIGVTQIVSARARTTRQALVILLVFWFASCLMIPRIVTDIAGVIHPTPSAPEFAAGIQKDQLILKLEQDRISGTAREMLAEEGIVNTKEPRRLTANEFLLEADESGNKIFDKHFNRLFDIYEDQDRLYQASSLFSPTSAVQSLSMGLAGTDFPTHRHFSDAADDYRRMLVRTMHEDIARNRPPDLPRYTLSVDYLRDRDLWETVPPFTYIAPDTGWTLKNYPISISLLLGWFVGVVVLTFVSLSKLRVD